MPNIDVIDSYRVYAKGSFRISTGVKIPDIKRPLRERLLWGSKAVITVTFSLVAPTTLFALRRAIPCWLEDADNGLTDYFRSLLHGLWSDLVALDDRMTELDKQIKTLADSNEVTQRLQQLRGVGPLVATTLVATVGTGEQFKKGKQMAAALGLTPRQCSSGDKQRLLGISKRGDVHLRTILIHGTRAVVSQANHREDPLSRWVTSISKKSHPTVAAVALADKTARMPTTEAEYTYAVVPWLSSTECLQ